MKNTHIILKFNRQGNIEGNPFFRKFEMNEPHVLLQRLQYDRFATLYRRKNEGNPLKNTVEDRNGKNNESL